MGTDCALLLADIFLYSYEAQFIQSLLSTGNKHFNFTNRCIDELLSINNPDFQNYLVQMYPAELEMNDTTESNTFDSYLDILPSIGRDGQLRTSLYDKGDDFNYHDITKFPFLSSNIVYSPAYVVFISQLIRYAMAWSSYECFILRAARLSCKLLGQGYVMKFFDRYGDLIKHVEASSPKCYINVIYSDTLHWSDISPNRDSVTELDLITVFDAITLFREVSIGHLQRGRLANRGRLVLQTPGPVPFGTYICSNVETILSWTCHVYGPFVFRTSLGISIFFTSLPIIGPCIT